MASQRPPCVIPAFPLALPTQPLPLSPRSYLTQYGPVSFPETIYFTEKKKKKIILFRIWFKISHELAPTQPLNVYINLIFHESIFSSTYTSGFSFPHPRPRPSHSCVFFAYCPLFPYIPNFLIQMLFTLQWLLPMLPPLPILPSKWQPKITSSYLTQSTTVIFQGQLGSLISIYLTQSRHHFAEGKTKIATCIWQTRENR